jgi:hypothetical protein
MMSDEQYRSAVRLRLCLPPICTVDIRTTACPCGGDIQLDPLHFHKCVKVKANAITDRHNEVLFTLQSLSKQCGITSDMVPASHHLRESLSQKDERKRPDIVFHHLRVSGRITQTVCDVGITAPFSDTHVQRHASATKPLEAAAAMERDKVKHYTHHICDEKQQEFIPFIMESSGALGRSAANIIDLLCKRYTGFDDDDKAFFKTHCYIVLSVALQRGNALVSRRGISILSSAIDIRSNIRR